MNSYLTLAIAAIIFIIIGIAAGIVATGLLLKETYEVMAAICNVSIDAAVSMREYWFFVKSVGAF